jgi:hypothetical protein
MEIFSVGILIALDALVLSQAKKIRRMVFGDLAPVMDVRVK